MRTDRYAAVNTRYPQIDVSSCNAAQHNEETGISGESSRDGGETCALARPS